MVIYTLFIASFIYVYFNFDSFWNDIRVLGDCNNGNYSQAVLH